MENLTDPATVEDEWRGSGIPETYGWAVPDDAPMTSRFELDLTSIESQTSGIRASTRLRGEDQTWPYPTMKALSGVSYSVGPLLP